MLNIEEIKKALGKKAVEFVPQSGRIGLGTGSTAEWFIRALAEHVESKKSSIVCLATSNQSETLARSLGLHIIPFHEWTYESVDLLVDGADSIDPAGNMVKGRGGALFREKLVAYSAKQYLILVDEGKNHIHLQGQIPVEIVPFGSQHTLERIRKRNFHGSIRLDQSRRPFITDNGNFIYDTDFVSSIQSPEAIHASLKLISGVVDTGLFLNFSPDILSGSSDGSISYKRTSTYAK